MLGIANTTFRKFIIFALHYISELKAFNYISQLKALDHVRKLKAYQKFAITHLSIDSHWERRSAWVRILLKIPSTPASCRDPQYRSFKKFSLFNDQPHSYAVKKSQRLSAIGSDPLTHINFQKVLKRVSRRLPLSAISPRWIRDVG